MWYTDITTEQFVSSNTVIIRFTLYKKYVSEKEICNGKELYNHEHEMHMKIKNTVCKISDLIFGKLIGIYNGHISFWQKMC